MDIILQRACNKCGVAFPRTDEYWHKNCRNKDGLAINCKGCMKLRASDRYTEKKAEINARKRAFYHNQKRRILNQQKDYRNRNRNAVRLRLRESRHRRRARELEVEGSHTKEDILLQYRSQHGKCWWCAKPVGNKYHVDHVRPITRGGSDNPENLVIACPFCNRSKKNKLPHEWDGRMF